MSSWSQKIFLHINATIGQKPALDRVMRFWAVWGIYILIAGLFVWSVHVLLPQSEVTWFLYLGVSALSFIVGFAVSAVIGRLLPAKRPKDALPGSRELITLKPFEYWKSFPSDHTIAAFTMVFTAMAFNVGASWALLCILFALSVGLARVYAGVHFPRDIFGGILVAAMVTLITMQSVMFFLENMFRTI
jgi:undecaprenyl-diphosphatase